MKNTVYAFARDRLDRLAGGVRARARRHFASYDVCSRATIDLVEHAWRRIATRDGEAPDAFVRLGQHARLATVTRRSTGRRGGRCRRSTT